MILVIGGYAQGKFNYVMQKYGQGNEQDKEQEAPVIFNHLHSWVKECLQRGGNPEEEILLFVKQHPDCIIISDEVGNGIVPADAFEREYRERTGRILVELASRAQEVERVICGIGQKIK